MRRHELDVFSLVAGLVFLAVAAGHLLDEAAGFDFDGRWVVPVAMVAIGVAGLASLAGRDRASVRIPVDSSAESGSETAAESAELTVEESRHGDERYERSEDG